MVSFALYFHHRVNPYVPFSHYYVTNILIYKLRGCGINGLGITALYLRPYVNADILAYVFQWFLANIYVHVGHVDCNCVFKSCIMRFGMVL